MPPRTPEQSFVRGMLTVKDFVEVAGADTQSVVHQEWDKFTARLQRKSETPASLVGYAFRSGRNAAIEYIRRVELEARRDDTRLAIRYVYNTLTIALAVVEAEILGTLHVLQVNKPGACKRLGVVEAWLGGADGGEVETVKERNVRHAAISRGVKDIQPLLSAPAAEWLDAKRHTPAGRHHVAKVRGLDKTAPARAEAFNTILGWCFEE